MTKTDLAKLAALDLDAICARADAAQPGEWVVDRDLPEYDPRISAVVAADDGDYEVAVAVCDESTAAFIAHARADVPALLVEVQRLAYTLANVERLCREYTPLPPPLFRGPGLSEHGVGYNAGTRDLAGAVLMTLRGEPADDDDNACCAECKPRDAS